jgi:hypothetical protein
MSWNASAGATGEDTTLKTLTCLPNADPNDELVKEIKADLAVAASVLEMMKDYMALLRENFNNDAPPFRKLAKLFDLGTTFDSLDGHYYGVCPGLRTGDLQGVAAEFGNLLGFIWSSAIVGHCPWAGKSYAPMSAEDRERILGDSVPADVPVCRGINHFNRIEGAPVNVTTVALLNFMWHLTKATDEEKQQYGYDYKGGNIASHRAPSIYPGTPREVFRLNYRYPDLGNYPPLSFLIDEMVQIADGMYLGQAIFATTKWLDRFDPKADPAEYHYQNFGYFLLFEPFWNAEAKRLFPFLEMPEVAVPAEVPKVAAAAAAPAPDKFATLTLADPIDGDVDSARLDAVRADIQTNGDILRTLKSYADTLTAEHKTDSPVFDKLHTLFNAGIAPQTMDGFYRGALISWQSQGLLAAFQENTIGIVWQAGRFFSPWIGKDFHQIDEAELARWTEGGEPMGSDPAYNCSNTVVWRTIKQKFTREVSKLAGVRIEDATPEEKQKYGYDAHTFFFIGRPNKTSMLPENKGKQIYQFNYRWKPLRNIPPDCFCIDEITQIAEGLFLGELIYATDWLKPWDPATPIEEYKYRLFGYFLLMDEEWHQRRLRIGFDLQDT